MNRRQFLTRASLAVAAMAIDPEMLVWAPEKRTFFDLGPALYRVQYGDWFKVSEYVYRQWVMTTVNGRMYGRTALIDIGPSLTVIPTGQLRPRTLFTTVVEEKRMATRYAEKELDRLVKWARTRPDTYPTWAEQNT